MQDAAQKILIIRLSAIGDVLRVLPAFQVLHPVGISFYVLQTLGYLVDVYRGEVEPERHLGFLALFVSFFPQLVTGPIERAGHLIPQLRTKREVNAEGISDGLRMMLWGTFKKVVVADRLAIYVVAVYNHPALWQSQPRLSRRTCW